MRFGRRRTPAAARYAEVERPAEDTPWSQTGWCAIDLELTGLDPRRDHIIAVGMVPVSAGRAQLGGASYSLVSSDRASAPAAMLAHRLRREELSGAPSLAAVRELIIDSLAGRVPIFHHAAVEQRFLGPQLARCGLRMPAAVDTEQLGRVWLARRGSAPPAGLSLAGLARALGQQAEPAHHALADAISTAQAFIALATLLDGADGSATVGSLLSASASASAGVRTAADSGRVPIG